MKKLIFLIVLLNANIAFAQQQGPQTACEKNLFEISGISNVMLARAQDEIANLKRQLVVQEEAIKRLKPTEGEPDAK